MTGRRGEASAADLWICVRRGMNFQKTYFRGGVETMDKA